MIDVFGGITVHTQDEFKNAYEHVVSFVDGIHVDYADGGFVPNTLLSLEETPLMNEHFAEAHLMVKDPVRCFDLCAQKSFKRVIFHPSSLSNISEQAVLSSVAHAKSLGLEVWLAIELNERIPSASVLTTIDGILFMTVKLGYSGGDFDSRGLENANRLRNEIKHLPLGVDGGVSDQTISSISRIGANHVISTSWLQSSDNVGAAVSSLKMS